MNNKLRNILEAIKNNPKLSIPIIAFLILSIIVIISAIFNISKTSNRPTAPITDDDPATGTRVTLFTGGYNENLPKPMLVGFDETLKKGISFHVYRDIQTTINLYMTSKKMPTDRASLYKGTFKQNSDEKYIWNYTMKVALNKDKEDVYIKVVPVRYNTPDIYIYSDKEMKNEVYKKCSYITCPTEFPEEEHRE